VLHRCIAAMIVRVYGSLATQRISGGQLLVMERVVVGRERFAWGLTLHARMIAQLDRCRSTGTGEFAFRLYPGSLVSGEGVDAAPTGSSRGAWGARASTEVVVSDFGSPRWWRRRALLHGAGGTDLAADAAGHTSIPLCWGGLPGGPGHGTASWGGF
jgi:hypothetical protein